MTAEFASGAGRRLNRRMARGAAWMIGLRFTDRLIGFLSTIVLARLLFPADFGLIALAMAMIGAIGDFAEFGFEMGLIQNQKTDRSHYDTAWTLGLIRGLGAAIVVALAAEPLAAFFNDPRLANVLFVLALAPFLGAFGNIGTVAFRKELALNKEFIFRIVPRMASVLATIALAFAWRNYWALVYGILVGTCLRLLMSYLMHSYRPRISIATWRETMGFSSWMLVTSIATLASQKGSILIIAKLLDAASLGMYSLAGQISNMAAAELIAPVKQALFPGYAKLAHDTTLLRKAFLDVYGILVLLALPAAIGIGLTAEFFVPLVFGPKWLGVIPLVEILVISGGLRALSSHVRPVYLAMNRPNLGAYGAIGRAIVYLPALFIGLTHYGIEGAAIANAVGNVAVLICSLYLMHRLLGVTLADVSIKCWRPLVCCAFMILSVSALKWYPPVANQTFADHLILLATSVLLGLAAYIGGVLLLWQLSGRPALSAEGYVLSYVADALRKRRSAKPSAGTGA